MSYRIGSFNCCNCKDNKEKLEQIIKLITDESLDMLLLQEFRFNNEIKLPPKWKIEQFTLAYQKKVEKKLYKKRINILEDKDDDIKGENLRIPSNDTGYAIMYDSSKFTKLDFSDDTRWKNILKFRNSLNKVARPPQIEIFKVEGSNIQIAIMNVHLTYSGEFSLLSSVVTFSININHMNDALRGFCNDDESKLQKIKNIKNIKYDGMAKVKKARVEEMRYIFELYEKVNNYSSNGCHRTTLVGGDFNLMIQILQDIGNTPNGKVYTTTEYNKKYAHIKDSTAEYNKNLNAYIDKKTTLHKLKCEREDYFYNSYDHFIVNQGHIKSDRINTVKWYKNDEGEEDNSIHYQKLSDHVPVYIDLNLT